MDTDQRWLKIYSARFWVLLFINVVFVVAMKYWLMPLTTRDVVSLEIAQTVGKAKELMDRFIEEGLVEKLMISVYADFVFIGLYCWLLMVAVRYLARLTGQDLLVRAARFFTVIIVIGGVCDVVENILLLQVLSGRVEELVVRMAYNFATAKFSMIIMTVMLVLVELMFIGVNYLSRKTAMAQRRQVYK